MISRYINLFKLLQGNTSCLLLGPRGTGKTALCQQFVTKQRSALTIDLLDRDIYQQHLANPGFFKAAVTSHLSAREKLTVFVDEVQKLPDILNDVHFLLEQQFAKKTDNVRFILTGSSARKLKRGSANLLAGRAVSLKLHPLNILEVDLDLTRSLTIGTLPAFYLNTSNTIRKIKSYAETYIKEEVLQESLVRSNHRFEKFLDFAAQVNGEPVNFSKLAKAASITSPTAESFFTILVDILLARRIDVWSFSEREKIATAPKYYFFDCGVLNALRGELNLELKVSSYRYGKLFETFIINQILAANDYLENDYKAYFWRTRSGTEVDLILARSSSDTPLAIEIKSEANPELKDLKGLLSFKKDNPTAELFCLCQTTAAYSLEDIKVLPWKEGIKKILDRKRF